VTETVVPGRTGILVPPNDLIAFSDACVQLLENEDERLRLAGGARAEALSRNWTAILDGVLDVYGRTTSVARALGDESTTRRAWDRPSGTSTTHPLALEAGRRR